MQDIVQFGLETPVYGVGVRVGPLPLGIYFAGGESELGKRDLGSGIGLRGGDFGKYRTQQLVFGFLGGEFFYSGEPIRNDEGKLQTDENGIPLLLDERANKKSYKMRYFSFLNDPVEDRKKRKKEKFQKKMVENILGDDADESIRAYLPKEKEKPFGYPANYIWQIDVFIGAYGGARVGVNLAEVFDFMIGLTTIDILNDDVESSE
ncbi:hypothetical protein O4O04_18625 [Leptospira sp. GIMC2001]|nr:hypothetical protein [Leptospira sp. GIMC2001]WCL49283.1 hypothetical protein O4O04_18625 [Leptospira sp. GIMC2001]